MDTLSTMGIAFFFAFVAFIAARVLNKDEIHDFKQDIKRLRDSLDYTDRNSSRYAADTNEYISKLRSCLKGIQETLGIVETKTAAGTTTWKFEKPLVTQAELRMLKEDYNYTDKQMRDQIEYVEQTAMRAERKVDLLMKLLRTYEKKGKDGKPELWMEDDQFILQQLKDFDVVADRLYRTIENVQSEQMDTHIEITRLKDHLGVKS